MLGNILCKQLFANQLVVTFSVGDHHNGHGRYAVRVSGPKQQYEHAFSLKCVIILSPQTIKAEKGRNYSHFVAWNHSPSISQECRDYHRAKMSWPSEWSRVGYYNKYRHVTCDWFTSLFESHPWSSLLCMWASFQSRVFECTVHSQKKSWLCLCRH